MPTYVAKRVRFRNGERVSVLIGPNSLPVHEVTLFLESFRRKGRASNTIHAVCCTLALLYRELYRAELRTAEKKFACEEVRTSVQVNLLKRFEDGGFLSAQELDRLVSLAQIRMQDADIEDEEAAKKTKSNVVGISRISMRLKSKTQLRRSIDIATQASRLRYIANFLAFAADYAAAIMPSSARKIFKLETEHALKSFRAHIPPVSKRARLDSRIGLSKEEQDRVVSVVRPDSAENPWAHGFVRRRNWLIVILLLATGMRRGELLGLQIGDLNPREPKLRILRRADAIEDARRTQPNAKTHDREIEINPHIMRAVWHHINVERKAIHAARKIPQIFVSDEGSALSLASVDKMFRTLRQACPDLSVTLVSHVMRHTWNERFSEQADEMELPEVAEQQARNQHQGWNDNSKTGTTYTRRHTARIANKISLKLQEQLDESLFKADE